MLRLFKDDRIFAAQVKFEKIETLDAEEFRRLTGVRRETFKKMLEVLEKAEEKKKKSGGRPSKLSIEDRLLMALEYLREYRTYFHVGKNDGLSETTCMRVIKWIEDVLIKSRIFSLPGQKALLRSDITFEIVMVDATETPVERPKKNKKNIILVKRKNIQ